MKSLRKQLRSSWIAGLNAIGSFRRAERSIVDASGVVVLTLHRVLPPAEFESTLSPRGMVMREKTFESLLKFISEELDVWDISQGTPDWSKAGSRPRVAVTFDDGWKDTAAVAFPLLQKYSIPATIFLCSGLMAKASPFWPEAVAAAWRLAKCDSQIAQEFSQICAKTFSGEGFDPAAADSGLDRLTLQLKSLPSSQRAAVVEELTSLTAKTGVLEIATKYEGTMGWSEVMEMGRGGTSFGSHTVNHEILTQLPEDQVSREVAESKSEIERQLGHKCETFAYPNGSWSHSIKTIVKEQGYALAFINSPGIWNAATDPWAIPRINVWEGTVTLGSGEFSAQALRYAIYKAATKNW
jgi:peptidoglycan/xylan/chitin deacetylase (PgdA/CDA1 family)